MLQRVVDGFQTGRRGIDAAALVATNEATFPGDIELKKCPHNTAQKTHPGQYLARDRTFFFLIFNQNYQSVKKCRVDKHSR